MPGPLELAYRSVDALKSAQSITEIRSVVGAAARAFGFDHFCMAGVPPSGAAVEAYVRIDAWPPGWADHYIRKSFFEVDPVIAHLRRAERPFRWSEAHAARRSAASDRMMQEAARDWKLVEGLTVPLRRADGGLATITYGSSARDLDPAADVTLHLTSIYAELRAGDLLDHRPAPTPALTAREIECLRWASAGKTVWEISVILNMSERTARFHLDTAARKLGARNKAHVIAEALRRGIIE